ncbi:helix-turn-helix transcriptional regulator [Actinacidiphila sp. DG2A-62]|uniref:helix-turn-helix transcriptional regulator n=1 Tax=Actinacidiphila sp. DG2A-62 TaxID=3108821 RepID=UPI002DBF2167|nr:helix-turn-helix transcriptional regulator [Actinacidiphila sp. DG2A-62]MEC3996387.1 helix-turn-helix transcriptional regulator [Actinacidiphila sp. DG2A-62]
MTSPNGIGHLLRGLREQAGRTRRDQAEHLGAVSSRFVDPENIKRWETEKRLPVPHLHETIARGYGIPVEEVRQAVAASRRYRRLASASRLSEDREDITRVERREFLGVSMLAAGIATEPWGRLAAALAGPTVDRQLTDQLVEATANLFVSEHHLPAELLVGRLGSHLEALTALIPRSGPHRRALTVAAGETAALAGWVAYDIGDMDTARHYYATAALAGREGGHPAVVALAMGYASYAAPAGKAREMLAAAQEHVRGAGYAAARSWLAAREAEEAAGCGDREGAVRALDRAVTAFDYADPAAGQAWIRFYQRSRLDSLTVATYSKLSHPDLGQAAENALTNLGDDDSKVSIVILSDAATGYLMTGNVDRGLEVGRRFMDAAVATPTTMGRQRLVSMAALLPPQYSAARDLAEDIRAALAT